MHYLILGVILVVTHGLAFLGGMAFKNKILNGLKKENEQLKSAAESASKKL